MIQLKKGLTGAEGDPEAVKRCYFIDPDWYERNGRLFAAFVESRMCLSCRRKLEAERALPEQPTADRARSKEAKRRPPADPVATIQSCCSRGDFITPKLPVLEAVFRLLLAKGARMEARQMRESLDSWPGCAGAYSHISPEALQRLLENDSYYGIRSQPSEGGQ